jgi:hypothetical protein
MTDTAHSSGLSPLKSEERAGVNREKKAPGGVEPGDGPRPFGGIGFVAEVGQLAEGGAGAEVGHPRSVGVALVERVRRSD